MKKVHIVVKGDTLSKIAQNHGITLAEILKKNPQLYQEGRNPNLIYPGETITIPKQSSFDNHVNTESGGTICPPGSLRLFFIHDFDDTPIPSLLVKITIDGKTSSLTTNSDGLIKLDDVCPGSFSIIETNTRSDLPANATETKPNNRYFPERKSIKYLIHPEKNKNLAMIMKEGSNGESSQIVSKKTTYVIFKKKKVYEVGLFAHIENKPKADLNINDVIGHTFISAQVPGSNGGLGSFSKTFEGGLFSSSKTITYKNEIARGFWPDEALESKSIISGVDGSLKDEAQDTQYYDPTTRDWDSNQKLPDYHNAHKFFDIDHEKAKMLFDYLAKAEEDPPKYILARTFRGVVTDRQTIENAVGSGTHCSTFAIQALNHIGISVTLPAFTSPASIIEAINGGDIPNNDPDVMRRIKMIYKSSMNKLVLVLMLSLTSMTSACVEEKTEMKDIDNYTQINIRNESIAVYNSGTEKHDGVRIVLSFQGKGSLTFSASKLIEHPDIIISRFSTSIDRFDYFQYLSIDENTSILSAYVRTSKKESTSRKISIGPIENKDLKKAQDFLVKYRINITEEKKK